MTTGTTTGGLGLLAAQALMVLIPLALSLSVHECAHAWAAKRLGDDTAERAGRLTLNPLVHADPIGTVALPFMILLAQGGMGSTSLPLFGWAKPTPVNAGRFRRTITARTGSMWVALAGPVSNFLLAFVAGLMLVLLTRAPIAPHDAEPLVDMCLRMVFINVGLAVFNLLPFSPLDGETVMAGLLPYAWAQRFERVSAQYGSLLLWALVLFGPKFLSVPVGHIARGILRVVTLLA